MREWFGWRRLILIGSLAGSLGRPCWASPGSEGASFLDIPVGARPAALGGAYSALANDAYSPVWNPSGLASADASRLALTHLSYLESVNYEFVGYAHPLGQGQGLGAAIQYFRPGDVAGTDASGAGTGDFSGYYAAYSLAFGQNVAPDLDLGVSGKIVRGRISDVSATAYGMDLGAFYRAREDVTVSAVIANIGTRLEFLSEGDSLPLTGRLGGAYRPNERWDLLLEGLYTGTGFFAMRAGAEWRPVQALAVRAGYKSDTLRGLSPLAGFTTGIGLLFWGHEFDYAWVPLGGLGFTQYFSLAFRFGERRA